jgi:hypothetical protein
MYPNGTILTIATRDAEVAERLLGENEQLVNAEMRPAKKSVRAKSSFWPKFVERNTLVVATNPCADCGD